MLGFGFRQAQHCNAHFPAYLDDDVDVPDGCGKDLVAGTSVDESAAAVDQRSLRARLLGGCFEIRPGFGLA